MEIKSCEKEIEEGKLLTKLQGVEDAVKDTTGWLLLDEFKTIEISHKMILQAERERLDGAETITVSEARKRLQERIIENNE